MKKKFLSIIAATMIAGIFLTGCGCANQAEPAAEASSESSSSDVDVEDLAKSLVDGIQYDQELTEISLDDVSNYITLEDDVTGAMFMSNGSTAEEVAVFKAPDEDSATVMVDNIQAFLDDQYDSFKDYIPDEADRVKNAVLKQEGQYVILCVSGDSDTATSIIEKAFQ